MESQKMQEQVLLEQCSSCWWAVIDECPENLEVDEVKESTLNPCKNFEPLEAEYVHQS